MSGRLRAFLLVLSLVASAGSGCTLLFEYPASDSEEGPSACSDGVDNDLDGHADCYDSGCVSVCPESGAAACRDALDNDHDGLVDCLDRVSCAGFCPEATSEDCNDAIDNDGDGLTDSGDPSCWPLAAPFVQRCASHPPLRFIETFDIELSEDSTFGWSPSGSSGESGAIAGSDSHPSVPGAFGSFRFNTTDDHSSLSGNLGSATHARLFTGALEGMELSFEAAVPTGTALRVALVPEELAPLNAPPAPGAESALLSVALDASVDPPLLLLDADGARIVAPMPPLESCGGITLCNAGFRRVTVRVRDGTFHAELGGTSVGVSAPARTTTLSRSRLVIWGGSLGPSTSSAIDDLSLTFPAQAPCGYPAPQITSCELEGRFQSYGHTVSVARDAAGTSCALVSASTGTRPTAVTAWTSSDGEAWAPSGSAWEVGGASADDLIGAAVAHDGERFLSALAYRRGNEARLALTRGACGDLSMVLDGPVLPLDAEAPSYVVGQGRHAIYFTRPPTDDTGRTLWRLSGADQDGLELEPFPLAELPFVGAPASIQAVGGLDLVMIHPTPTGAGPSAIGLMLGTTDAASWTALEPARFLDPLGRAGFDAAGAAAASIGWDGQRGFLLYSGSRERKLAVGTAVLAAATEPEPQARVAPVCGDARCDSPAESCESCSSDCACPGLVKLENPFAPDLGWLHLSDLQDARAFSYPTGDAVSWLGVNFDRQVVWLPLPEPVVGDFELAFDLTPSAQLSDNSLCTLGVGLAESDVPDPTSNGIFARLALDQSCNAAFSARPLVRTADGVLGDFDLDVDRCLPPALDLPSDTVSRLVLRREGGRVSLRAPGSGRCESERTIEYDGALRALRALAIGSFPLASSVFDQGVSARVSNLTLRLLEDPDDCPSDKQVCVAERARACVDLAESQEHCGACGSPCMSGANCEAGACGCSEGLDACEGTCVDLQSSVGHCGACGNACSSICLVGECDAGESCNEPKVLPTEPGTVRFDLGGSAPNVAFPCAAVTGGDLVFSWTPPRSGQATIEVSAKPQSGGTGGAAGFVDTVLGVASQETCTSPSEWLGCNDDTPALGSGSRLELPVTSGTPYHLLVGLYGQPEPGTSAVVDLSVRVR